MRTAPAALATALLVAALGIAGCSSGSSEAAPGSSGSGPSASAPSGSAATSSPAFAAADRIDVVLVNGRITPKPAVHTVRLGDRVRLTVTSDRPDQVHLHGYDKEIEIQPHISGTIDFVANVPGIFEVETHKTNLQLLQLEVK